MIAAPSSSGGKTTVSLGIMAILTRRGVRVQPFKCGPDYIDTKFHAAVCGRPSVNLDSYMASTLHLRELYARYSAEAEVCIAEGMMGLYDGYERDRGSSAETASILRLPVILVVNAASAAYSTAALLRGFIGFRDDVRIIGVIFDKVGSPRHLSMLEDVCQDIDLRCFGYLPKDAALEQKSRYLGLDFSDSGAKGRLERLVSLTEKHIDIGGLLDASRATVEVQPTALSEMQGKMKICVARDDESFSFIYNEHLDILRRLGEVTFFSPASGIPIPSDTDLLYLPGGYPEKHAEELSAAEVTMRSVRDYIEGDGRTLAECGGMIYLSRGIHFDDAPTFVPLTGVLPFSVSCRREHRRLSLGYRSFRVCGQQLRGHEFHYSQIPPPEAQGIKSAYLVYDAKGVATDSLVFRYKNLLASYVHLYWGEADIMRLFGGCDSINSKL